MSNTPSCYQIAVYNHLATGLGHCVVQARAGSGKTTTIMGALSSIPSGRSIALFAFNKSIALELEKRAPKHVKVKTLHSHGFTAIRRKFPSVKMDDKKSVQICEDLFGCAVKNDPVRGYFYGIRDLVSKAKDVCVPIQDGIENLVAELDKLVDRFDIDCPEDVYDRDAFVAAAAKVLLRSKEITSVVDFADMCWLPLVDTRISVPQFDEVLVDETQDLSPSQIHLLLRSIKRNGRITVVGDDKQAIYAFRGADVDTIPTLIRTLDAKVLPLSVTYRCCRAVVKLANQAVPDLEAAPNAIEGSVVATDDVDMIERAQPGDMIISRTNAPLSTYCLALLKAGKRATIKGRDIGAGLVKLVERSKARTIDALLVWLEAWQEKELARLIKQERSTQATEDRYGCLVALSKGMSSIQELKAKIEHLFSDRDDRNVITLGTTHKLKGLEANRVWMIAETYKPEVGGEETNCWYVAVTRAKDSLMMVRQIKGADLNQLNQ